MENIKQKLKKVAKYFNDMINIILLKSPKKESNKFHVRSKSTVSRFNKYLISIISILFIYLFYLSIPTLYEKTWIQRTIENKLESQFGINFSISSEIIYQILPSPHYLIKNTKIFNDNLDSPKDISQIKNLKVFISQKNFFFKEKINIRKVSIDKANFSLQRSDFSFLKKFINTKFSEKKISITDSQFFLKDEDQETISIIYTPKIFFYYDNLNLRNKLNLKGEIFKTPFDLEIEKNMLSSLNDTKLLIEAPKLKLKFIDKSTKKINGNSVIISGSNNLSVFNSSLITNYQIKENLITFGSEESRFRDNNVEYNGTLNSDPFDLILDVKIEDMDILKIINPNSIFLEFFKSKLLFNENISTKIFINKEYDLNDKLFNSGKLFLNIDNGNINFNQSTLINEKIGSLKIVNSNLFFKGESLLLRSEFNFNLNNSDRFYSFLQTSKKLRKPIKTIFFTTLYDFSNNQILVESFKIDELKPNENYLDILNNFNNFSDNQIIKLIRNKAFINKMIEAYAG